MQRILPRTKWNIKAQKGIRLGETGMAGYKHIDTSPRLLAVDLEHLILPGSFEHALHYLNPDGR